MVTLQKMLEFMDSGAKTANQMTSSKPLSEARRMLATLKVPRKFHELNQAERPAEAA